MKKLFILLFAFVAFAITSTAQVVFTNSTAADTLTNTDTLTGTKSVTKDLSMLWSVQITTDRISGTLAGVVRIYGSNDGTNYLELPDTIAITNADPFSGVINVGNDFQYKYFKVIYYQTGTSVSVPKFYWYYKSN
jgi:hypothetical protein